MHEPLALENFRPPETSCGFERVNLLRMQDVARIREASPHVIRRKSRVACKNLFFRPASGEMIHDLLHRNASTCNYRLSDEHFRIYAHAFTPSHAFNIANRDGT